MKMKIHNKGQVVLPAKIRKKFHLEIGDDVNVTYDNEGIHLYPVTEESIELKGSIKEEYLKYRFPSEDEINKATIEGFVKK
ncbi:MAG: AbrB/MazE/SpoVT family DNA-binding domain-containing protein [Candidatus Marinimicrobia bacterium]|nr:AbrB/MazE/SpoVT family DNA-binding domain-containing protein [Candidatus Neomarinimicrobiota bacterium]